VELGGGEEVGGEQPFLGAEVAVEGARRHAGGGGDLLDGDVGVAALVEQVHGRVHDPSDRDQPVALAKGQRHGVQRTALPPLLTANANLTVTAKTGRVHEEARDGSSRCDLSRWRWWSPTWRRSSSWRSRRCERRGSSRRSPRS